MPKIQVHPNHIPGACQYLGVKPGEIFYAGSCINPCKIIDNTLFICISGKWKEPKVRTLGQIIEWGSKIRKEPPGKK